MGQPGDEYENFVHVYSPPAQAGGRVLLLLHGTGGNEHDLIPVAQMLDAQAGVLSPRGQVLENGMPRFFRRLQVANWMNAISACARDIWRASLQTARFSTASALTTW